MMDEQPRSLRDEVNTAGNLLVFVARSLAVTVEVFLHRSGTFGERYFGMQAGAGFLAILFYPLFWEGYDPIGLFYFIVAYWLMLICARIGTFQRRRRGGPQPHSRYAGTPRLLRFLTRMSEATCKCAFEPMLVFFLATFMCHFSLPLGGYLMLAAVGLAISTNVDAAHERRRLMELHDAYLEQRYLAERFREMRGE